MKETDEPISFTMENEDPTFWQSIRIALRQIGNVAAAFALLIAYLQIRILYVPIFWEPIMSFNTWHHVDDHAFVQRDLRRLAIIYAHVAAAFIFVYTDWLWCLAFVLFITALNFVVSHFKVKRFRKRVSAVCELTGLKDYQVSSILRDSPMVLSDIEAFYKQFNRPPNKMDVALMNKGLVFADYHNDTWNSMLTIQEDGLVTEKW